MVHPAVPISVAQPDSNSQVMDDDGGSLDSFDENDAGRSTNIASIRGRSGTRGMRRHGEGGRKGGPRRPSMTSPRGSSANLKLHPVTVDTCPTLKHLTHVCMDTVFPSAPEKIYNLMFTSGFMKEFFINDQRLMGESSILPHYRRQADVEGRPQNFKCQIGHPRRPARTCSLAR